MGMCTTVAGVRDLDSHFSKMMEVKLACEKAGIGYPDEVKNYFKYPEESLEYLTREMELVIIDDAITEYVRDSVDGWEIDLTKIPKDIKAIRFENSY